jgi:hypothetical protein
VIRSILIASVVLTATTPSMARQHASWKYECVNKRDYISSSLSEKEKHQLSIILSNYRSRKLFDGSDIVFYNISRRPKLTRYMFRFDNVEDNFVVYAVNHRNVVLERFIYNTMSC